VPTRNSSQPCESTTSHDLATCKIHPNGGNKKIASSPLSNYIKGHGIRFIPAEKSPAASTPSRIREEKQIALDGRAKLQPSIIPVVQRARTSEQSEQQLANRDFLAKVNEKVGKNQMEGNEYSLSPISGRTLERQMIYRGHNMRMQYWISTFIYHGGV